MNEPKPEPKLAVKNYKSGGEGREGLMWTATLWVDGKKAALLRQDGSGGDLWVDWTPSGGNPFRPADVGRRVLAYVDTLPPIQGSHGQPSYKADLAHVVDGIINDMLAMRTIKRWCKTKIVALTPDTQPGQFTIYRMPPTSVNVSRLRQTFDEKFGPGTYEIVNDRYVA